MTKSYDRSKWLDETSSTRRASLPRRVVTYGATGLGDSDLMQLVLGDKPRARMADLLRGEPGELVASGLLSETQAGRFIGALELCRRLAAHRDWAPSPSAGHRALQPRQAISDRAAARSVPGSLPRPL